jgi:ABC transporter substrate binding protein
VRAQQPVRVKRIGILIPGAQSDPNMQERVAAFLQTLEKLGWSEGRNIQIDIRFAAGKPDQYGPMAKELTTLQPDVIFAYSTPIAAALQRESRTIPIVFVNVSDPIETTCFRRPVALTMPARRLTNGVTTPSRVQRWCLGGTTLIRGSGASQGTMSSSDLA